MTDLTTHRVTTTDWLRACPQNLISVGTFTLLNAWGGFISDQYDYDLYQLETSTGDDVQAVLSLLHIKHPLFGNYLASAPFASYGGFAYATQRARDAILNEARNLMTSLRAKYVSVRFADGSATPPPGWVQHPSYATYFVDLNEDPESLMPNFSSDHRNHIRKSQRNGFTVKFGRLDLLDNAYEAIARSMHELGSPYHSKKYLRAMADSLGDALEFVVLYTKDGSYSGGGVFIKHGDVVTNLYANILREYRSIYAGEHLYWSIIDRYSRAGLKTLDLGRSLLGSGNETFKMKWKPRRQILAYWFALQDDAQLPELNQKNPKFQFAIDAWKIMPRFVVRLLGPTLINGLA